MRLFLALPLSPQAVERLTAFRLRWSTPGDGLRWSVPEQWHITLQFYGDADQDRAQCLGDRLRSLASSPPVELTLGSLETFAAKGILFASVTVSPALEELHKRVIACGAACGVLPESRPFRPHVTLARSKGPKGAASLRRLARPDLPSLRPELHWAPQECVLLQSVLRPGGAEYTVIARVPLQTPTSMCGGE